MAESIRGGGLLRADRALEALLENPEQPERARARFSESPPPYRSQPSGTTTLSQSPDQPSETQQQREERKLQLYLEHRASLPYHQFNDQYSEELARLFEADRNRTYQYPPGLNSIYKHAEVNVRMRWIEQGTWKDEWNSDFRPGGRWKHEEPLKPESETGSDTMPGLLPHRVTRGYSRNDQSRATRRYSESSANARRRAPIISSSTSFPKNEKVCYPMWQYVHKRIREDFQWGVSSEMILLV
ncbi:hypothetical protein VTK56DRAFT_5848 [Thermocarpiscus australiensis]